MGDTAVCWTPRDLASVMLYSNDKVVERYARSSGIPLREAHRHFEGLKQFLFMCAAKPGSHTPSNIVAAVWQVFLLFTKDYGNFCRGYLGRFIDHRPAETPSREAYSATRREAGGMLGRLDEGSWPTEGDGASRYDGGPGA